VRLLTGTIAMAERAGADDLLGLAAHQAFYVGDDDAALRLNAQVVARARATGAVADLMFTLPRLVQADLLRGRWTAAAAGAAEAVQLAGQTGRDELAAMPVAWLGLLAALRGHEEGFWAHTGRVDALAATHPLGVFRAPASEIVQWARAMQKLATGRPASAFALLDELTHPVVAGMAMPDRIEAAVQAGHRDRARGCVARLDEVAEDTGAAWARARAAHGHGLLSDGPVAATHFQDALAQHGRARRPFERARTELAYGEALRRARRRVDARPHLESALDGFDRLGATPWADRAGAELRACGRTARRRDPSTLLQLTPQELQVARFVAGGLPTREVAAQLFLSPRTVDFHLRNVFTKLGIRSRSELAALHLD
jgi:DNA-binding CsgD family transcriptional regulator